MTLLKKASNIRSLYLGAALLSACGTGNNGSESELKEGYLLGSRLSATQVADALRQGGWENEDDVETAVCVGVWESALWNSTIQHNRSKEQDPETGIFEVRSTDWGLFQINDYYHYDKCEHLISDEDFELAAAGQVRGLGFLTSFLSIAEKAPHDDKLRKDRLDYLAFGNAMMDPVKNAACARLVHRGAGFNAWGGYKNSKRHKASCDDFSLADQDNGINAIEAISHGSSFPIRVESASVWTGLTRAKELCTLPEGTEVQFFGRGALEYANTEETKEQGKPSQYFAWVKIPEGACIEDTGNEVTEAWIEFESIFDPTVIK